MSDEPNTPATAGTDNVETTNTDTVENWDYYDPDEDQEPVEAQDEATDEGDEDQAEEAEVGEDDDADENSAALITLKDGAQVTMDELTSGYFRQADYSRKTQEIANTRTVLETNVQRIEGITQAFIDHLSAMVPALPPQALAYTDPNKHYLQTMQHQQAMDKVRELIALGESSKEVKDTMTAEQRKQTAAEGNARIAEMFPETKTDKGRQKFFTEAVSAATELGFTTKELNGVLDPRMFALAHWARIGMKATQARNKVQAKVANVPPVTPRKPGQGAKSVNGNESAMRKLTATRSIWDAMAVDFE